MNTKTEDNQKKGSVYELDGRVPLIEAVPFGLQHVLAMFVSNITPIIILGNVVGLDEGTSAMMIQNCMIVAGIATLIQLYPIWRIGSRLPIVMGTSFTFLSAAIGVATTQGMGALMGAVILGGVIEGCMGLFARYWLRFVPHVVAAAVVTAIGFSLLPIGANSFAGGVGAEDFGSLQNWIVGSFTLLVCLCFQVFAKGTLRSLSVLIGLVAGYILALCLGMVDFSGVRDADIIALPRILPFKPELNIGAVLSILAIYFVSATETIGDTSALCAGALHRMVKKRELGASISCDGFASSLAGLLGSTPITSFSQNVGLSAMSGVVNRFAIATGASVMLLGGLFPVVGHFLTTIPQAVLGGCSIMMFGAIMFAGFGMLARCGFGDRNMVIVSLSLSIGLGFTQATGMFAYFPEIIRTVFSENCVAVVFIMAVVLNQILPGGKKGGIDTDVAF